MTHLEIHCLSLPKPRSTHLHQSPFADIIKNTPKLQHLALGGNFLINCYSRCCKQWLEDICLCNRDWEELFLRNTWSRLTSLSLGSCGSGIKRVICFANKQTLRELRFVGCCFSLRELGQDTEPTPASWAALGEELDQFLKLQFVGVWTRKEWTRGWKKLVDQRTLQSFRLLIMQKTSHDLLIMDSEPSRWWSVENRSRTNPTP